MNNKVVLAFSGGLDTSFCVPYLKNERGLEVHTVMVNTGGFSEEEAKAIEHRALTLGAASHKNFGDYYRLKVCVPQIPMLNANAQCDGLWSWSLWKVIRS